MKMEAVGTNDGLASAKRTFPATEVHGLDAVVSWRADARQARAEPKMSMSCRGQRVPQQRDGTLRRGHLEGGPWAKP